MRAEIEIMKFKIFFQVTDDYQEEKNDKHYSMKVTFYIWKLSPLFL